MIELRAGAANIVVDTETGGRLASWEVEGNELLVQREPNGGNDPFGWGSFPMVPWAGRIRRGSFGFDGQNRSLPINLAPHAIHGTAYDRCWSVDSVTDCRAELSVALEAPWELGGRASQTLELTDGSLRQVLRITAGEQAMPASLGWHPWFRRGIASGDPLELDADFSHAQLLARDDDFITDGTLAEVAPMPWDDCFVGVGSIVLRWPGVLEIRVDHDCPNVVIYTPDHAICVEPQSAPPDVYNLDPRGCRLEPGETLERTVTWSWTALHGK